MKKIRCTRSTDTLFNSRYGACIVDGRKLSAQCFVFIDRIANHVNRFRGYQFRSEGPGEAKKNVAPFNVYANNGVETPVAPDANDHAGELEGKGFAEKQ